MDTMGLILNELRGINTNIGAMQVEIANINTKVDTMQVEIANINTKVDTMQVEIANINTRLDRIETRMGSLETRMDSLEAKIEETKVELKEFVIENNIEIANIITTELERHDVRIKQIEGIVKENMYDITLLKNKFTALENLKIS